MPPEEISLDAARALFAPQAQPDTGRRALDPAEISTVLGVLNSQLPGGPQVGPRTLTLEEANQLLRDRASGLGGIGQAVRALPENLRNPVASTITTMVNTPLGLFNMPHLAARGIDWTTDQLNRLANIPETSREYRTNLAPHVPPMGTAMTQDVMQRIGVPPTEANTPSGRITQDILAGTVGSMILGGPAGTTYLRGAGVRPTAVRSAQLGAASGAGSGIAGEATRGTDFEIPARLTAGILLPTIAALEQSRMGGVTRIMGRAVDDATPAQLRYAQQLLDDARAGNHPLTVPEALAQARVPGATQLLIMQRLAEQQSQGSGSTFNAFRQYQAQRGEEAINRVADAIAPPVPPQNSVRYDVGVANQRQAEGVIREAERARTATTGAAGYTAAETAPLGPTDVAPIIQRIRAIRGGPNVAQTGPMYPQLVELERQLATEATTPGFTIGRANEIYQQWRSNLEGAGMPGADPNLRAAAVRLGPVIDTIRDDLLHLNPDYAAGSRMHAQLSPAVERTAEGLPGAIAATPNPQKQITEILSQNTRPAEVTRTLNAMRTAEPPLGGAPNPQAVNDLVRLRIDNALGDVPRFQGVVATEQLGAKFNALLRTDPIAAANFAAALETVPNGTATLAQLNRLLDVFEAQGRRLNVGSPTDVNAVLRGMLTGNVVNAATVTGIPAMIRQGIDRWSYGRRLQDIADVSTSPTGLLDIMAARNERSALPRGLLAADAVAVQRALDEERRGQAR